MHSDFFAKCQLLIMTLLWDDGPYVSKFNQSILFCRTELFFESKLLCRYNMIRTIKLESEM